MKDWWLKIKRANKHMVDINEESKRYASTNPYTIEHIKLSDSDNEIRFRLRIVKQPNPMIAIMLGDFIHNLRSALDYIVVASAPKQYRHYARFPIECTNIFAKDKNRKLVVRGIDGQKRRRSFRSAIRGLSPEAISFIIAL